MVNTPRFPDIYGKDAACLADKKLWLLDMDGTIYMENHLYECTPAFLDAIRATGGRYVFITNNSSRSVNDYVEKVQRMGIDADRENFFTSTQATILYLQKNHPGAKVYVQATKACVRELTEGGIDVTEEICDDASVVLVGFDLELTSQKLWNTCAMLYKENTFLAINPDLVCPVAMGYIPDCGSICQMLYNATKRRPVFIGKPEPTMINIVREKLGYTAEETVVVGDRLYTDIAAGLNAEVTAVCVLSGEATREDIETGEIKPDIVLEDVGAITRIMKGNAPEA